MRTKVTLVLVFLNVALFFFIFKFERGWRTERASLEARRRVLGPETADIRALRIDGPGLTPVALKRTGGDWALTEPLEWPANPHAVTRIVNELQFLEHESSFSVRDLEQSGQSLVDYGLANPRMVVTFTSGGEGGREVTLRLGDETKAGNLLYILSPDGQRVHVVNLSLARSLALPVEELRADTIFSIPYFEARSLTLQNPANLRVRLRREGGNRWAFEAPIIARANKVATELAINALNTLRVRSFTPPGAAPSLGAAPALRITLEGNNRRETLVLGAELGTTAIAEGATGGGAAHPDIEFSATLEGKSAAFTVAFPGHLLDLLRNAQETLRESRILEFEPAAVTGVTLGAPNQPELILQRDSAAPVDAPWQLVRRDPAQGPQTQPADPAAVQRLLEQLSALAAAKFQSDAPSDADLENWGFNQPEREITLTVATSPNATRTLKLQIGVTTPRDGRAYARLAGERFIYAVAPAILDEATVSPLAYRARLLRELPATATITALRITDRQNGAVVVERNLADAPADPALAGLAAQLRTVRARRFVADGFAEPNMVGGEERPWRYQVDATVALPAGTGTQTETETWHFTERVAGTLQLGGSERFAATFELEQPLLDALWRVIYADRDPGPPAASPASTAAEPKD
ncbi:MAG: DUF4340 domain-containing protein [Opitutaceae bacterium]|nr:DUF4340 domain-containing protein [Opitutaceae bacterium]